MHEKTIATIEIELAPFPGKPTHIIRRTIDRNKGATGKRSRGVAASIYEINDEVVRMEAIKTLVKETYRIQIANLCTFLPQDRVGSFSGFNSQQLLQETEKSVSGTQHLYDDHERLIQLEAELLSSESNMATVKAELDRLEEEVNRLEDAKKLMEEREESVQKYKLYQQKMLWVEFEELRTLAVEKKVEKNELKKSLKQAQEGLQPLQDEIQKLEREYAGGKQRRVALQRKIDSCQKQHHHGIGKAERHCDEIDGLQSELVAFEANQRRAEKLVAQKRQAVEDLKAILRDYPPAEEIDERCKLAQEELRAAKLKLREAKNAFMQIRS
jgi:chromosome segregation ATPase